MKIRNRPARTFSVLVFLIVAFACERTVVDGQFKYLKLGSNKSETVNQMRIAGVSDTVKVVVPRFGIESFNYVSKLSETGDISGMVIQGPEYYATIELENGAVTDVIVSATPLSVPIAVESGMKQAEAMAKLQDFLLRNRNFGVSPLPSRPDSIRLQDITEAEWAVLCEADVWSFHEKGQFSKVTLFFESDVLTKLTHEWSLVELP